MAPRALDAGAAAALNLLGPVAIDQGASEQAEEALEESMILRRHVRDRWGISTSLHHPGTVARAQGNFKRAAALYEESASIRDVLGDVAGLAISYHDQAMLAATLGDESRALALLQLSVSCAARLGDTVGMAQALEGLAMLTTRHGRWQLAAQLLGAAAARREEAGVPLALRGRVQHERLMGIVRAALGTTFDDSWTQGRTLPWEGLVDAATQENEGLRW